MKRARKAMSRLERELADRFSEVVLAKRPILALPYRDGRVDPHHVIRAQTLRAHTSTLEREEAWAIVWDPDNGIPVDRAYHDQLTTAFSRLNADELRPENLYFAHQHGLDHLLTREVPSLRPERAPTPIQNTEWADG